ncbi:MAG: GerAB/ArcD/ProY family transporter [Bacillota bacterium]
MLERGRISCIQTIYLLTNLVGATAVMYLPALVAKTAGRDFWLVPVLSMLPGLYIVLVVTSLGKRFPGRNIFQCLQDILGKWPGKIMLFLYLLFFFHTNGLIITEFSGLMSSTVMPNTPQLIFSVLVLLVCAQAVWGGLEVLARTFEILAVVIISFLILVLFLAVDDINIQNLFPVMERGVAPVIKASLAPVAWQGEVVLLGAFLPYLSNPDRGFRCAAASVVALMFILMSNAILVTTVMSAPIVAGTTYPTYEMIRYIGGMELRYDAIIIAYWFAGLFGKISLFYYSTVLCGAQLMGLRNYRPLVIPFGAVLAAASMYQVRNSVQLAKYIAGVWPYIAYIFEYVIPTAILALAVLLKRKGGEAKANSE